VANIRLHTATAANNFDLIFRPPKRFSKVQGVVAEFIKLNDSRGADLFFDFLARKLRPADHDQKAISVGFLSHDRS
jgi:hypothetical protein